MTSDEAKGYFGYIIARLGVRDDSDRIKVMARFSELLKLTYKELSSVTYDLNNPFNGINKDVMINLLTIAVSEYNPKLVKIFNFNYIVNKAFTELKAPNFYYQRDKWLNKVSWMHKVDGMISRNISRYNIINNMWEEIRDGDVNVKMINIYLDARGVKKWQKVLK